jgi:charged multivesicular body protein 2A
MLDKAIRELDRERLGLQNQDKKLITEIKKMAKANQMVRRPLCAAATG